MSRKPITRLWVAMDILEHDLEPVREIFRLEEDANEKGCWFEIFGLDRLRFIGALVGTPAREDLLYYFNWNPDNTSLSGLRGKQIYMLPLKKGEKLVVNTSTVGRNANIEILRDCFVLATHREFEWESSRKESPEGCLYLQIALANMKLTYIEPAAMAN